METKNHIKTFNHQYKNVNQLKLRSKIERNMDKITDIINKHKDDDYKRTAYILMEEVYRKVRPELCNSIDPLSGYVYENKLKSSLEFAIKKHQGQYRDSGDLYVSHPVQVGYLIAQSDLPMDLIVLGHLHDVPEENMDDAESVLYEIKKRFGKKVYSNVLALSIFENGENKDDEQMDNLLFISEYLDDYSLPILKLKDSFSNLYTKKFMLKKNGMTAEERQRKFSLTAQRNLMPVAEFFDKRGNFDLHMASYLQELIDR